MSFSLHVVAFRGVLVLNVSPNSGAEAAGIRPTRHQSNGSVDLGDIIVAVDGVRRISKSLTFLLLAFTFLLLPNVMLRPSRWLVVCVSLRCAMPYHQD